MGGFPQHRFIVALLALSVSALAVGAAPAAGTAGVIQPGDVLYATGLAGTDVLSQCTLGFVFDGIGANAGAVYISADTGCVGAVGSSVSTEGHANFGVVAFRTQGINSDFALIQIHSGFVPLVDGSVKGHPGYPTGFTTAAETNPGDLLQISGYGVDHSADTQESRVAVVTLDNDLAHLAYGAFAPDDVGGPLVHIPTGKALGVISTTCTTNPASPCSEYGPSIPAVVSYAAAGGISVKLRTA